MIIDGLPINRASEHGVRIAVTPESRYGNEYRDEVSQVLSRDDGRQAYDFVKLLPGYAPTPLLESGRLAHDCRVASVLIKDEGSRLPTHSFKILGPPYALARQLFSRFGSATQSPAELTLGRRKCVIQDITACAATSGNHGRALAWAAAEYGCQCRIYMPESTGAFREQQIRRFGGTTIRVPGTYDDSVACAARDSEQHGYVLVGSGARADSQVLRHILHGYSVLGEELISAFHAGGMATHVFIPAGSGRLAAAVTARLWLEFGGKRPKTVIVQPHEADSGYQSCLKSTRVASRGSLATIMDGLSVRELSVDAWTVLKGGAFAFMTIGDDNALAMLKQLAQDERLAIGETGIAALAAFTGATKDPDLRRQLGLNEDSRVVLVSTEGVTDPPVVNDLLSDLR